VDFNGGFCRLKIVDTPRYSVNSIFVPEVVQFRKVSVSCSIITAIKRKNPIALLNPIFLDIRW